MGGEDGGQTTNGRRRFVRGAFGAKSAMFGCSRPGGGGEGPRGSKVLCHGAGGGRHRGAPWGDPKALLGSGMAAGGSLRTFGVWGRRGSGWGGNGGVCGSRVSWGGSWGSLRLRGGLH